MKAKKKNLVIKVPTKELWKKVIEKAVSMEKDCEWRAGSKKINAHYWDDHKQKSVIYIEKDEKGQKKLSCQGLDIAIELHPDYTFLTAKEYLAN